MSHRLAYVPVVDDPSGWRTALGIGTLSIVSKTVDYTLTGSDDIVIVDSTSAARTMTLPTAVGAAKTYTIKRSAGVAGTNLVTVATTSSQTIDGVTTWPLGNAGDSLTVAPLSGNWVVI